MAYHCPFSFGCSSESGRFSMESLMRSPLTTGSGVSWGARVFFNSPLQKPLKCRPKKPHRGLFVPSAVKTAFSEANILGVVRRTASALLEDCMGRIWSWSTTRVTTEVDITARGRSVSSVRRGYAHRSGYALWPFWLPTPNLSFRFRKLRRWVLICQKRK